MRGKAASNSQAAICSLRPHRLAFTHYKRQRNLFSSTFLMGNLLTVGWLDALDEWMGTLMSGRVGRL
jgi:hypothetical protein